MTAAAVLVGDVVDDAGCALFLSVFSVVVDVFGDAEVFGIFALLDVRDSGDFFLRNVIYDVPFGKGFEGFVYLSVRAAGLLGYLRFVDAGVFGENAGIEAEGGVNDAVDLFVIDAYFIQFCSGYGKNQSGCAFGFIMVLYISGKLEYFECIVSL